MKKAVLFVIYAVAAVAGAALIIFNSQAAEDSRRALDMVIMAIGICFIVPGVFQLIASLKPHRDAEGRIVTRPWFSTSLGIIALIWGVLMICMPSGFLGKLNLTIGVSLIIVSLAQALWIVRSRRTNGAPVWLYVIPLVVIVIGIYIILIPEDFQNPGADRIKGCIIGGITLILWAVNGFMSLPRRIKTVADIRKEERQLETDRQEVKNEKESSDKREPDKAAEAQADNSAKAKENKEKKETEA